MPCAAASASPNPAFRAAAGCSTMTGSNDGSPNPARMPKAVTCGGPSPTSVSRAGPIQRRPSVTATAGPNAPETGCAGISVRTGRQRGASLAADAASAMTAQLTVKQAAKTRAGICERFRMTRIFRPARKGTSSGRPFSLHFLFLPCAAAASIGCRSTPAFQESGYAR